MSFEEEGQEAPPPAVEPDGPTGGGEGDEDVYGTPVGAVEETRADPAELPPVGLLAPHVEPRAPRTTAAPGVAPAPEPEAPARSPEPRPDAGDDLERFDAPGATKLGIVGGKGVGKSYLFQAMVYRCFSGAHSGALTYFLENDSIRLFQAKQRQDEARPVNVAEFLRSYSRWERLMTTHITDTVWYRLRLRYRTGLLGRGRSALDVELLDGSGEAIFGAKWGAMNRDFWRDGFQGARVMVFCLPLWVAFPGPDLSEADWAKRETHLTDFQEAVENFEIVRSRDGGSGRVSSILALTMADDRRSALSTLRERWIVPYMDSPHSYLRELRRARGVARYLANARKVSEALHEELLAVRDPLVAGVPRQLDLGAGKPWLVPVSAIEGGALDVLEREEEEGLARGRRPAPVPVHVELPLLVALCRRTNALM